MFFHLKESWKELSNEEDDPPEFTPPPPLPPPRDPHNGKVEPSFFPGSEEIVQRTETRSLGCSLRSAELVNVDHVVEKNKLFIKLGLLI